MEIFRNGEKNKAQECEIRPLMNEWNVNYSD